MGLLGRRPDVGRRLVLCVQVGGRADLSPGDVCAVESVYPQFLGWIVAELLDFTGKPHNLAGACQDFQQLLFAVLGDDEVHPLAFSQFVSFCLGQFELGQFRALNLGPVCWGVGLRELRTGARPRPVDRALVALVEGTGLLGCRNCVGDVEAAFLWVGIVDVADGAQDVVACLFGPAQDVMVGNVDIHLFAAPAALLAWIRHPFAVSHWPLVPLVP